MLCRPIPRDFDELFENRALTPMTSNGELRAIMEMTVHFSLVFIVRILRSKHSVAKRTRKVFDMVLFIERSDVRPPQGRSTGGAEEIDATKVVCFAERVFQTCLGFLDGKEFRGDADVAFLRLAEIKAASST
jgi:hypothetical protein